MYLLKVRVNMNIHTEFSYGYILLSVLLKKVYGYESEYAWILSHI